MDFSQGVATFFPVPLFYNWQNEIKVLGITQQINIERLWRVEVKEGQPGDWDWRNVMRVNVTEWGSAEASNPDFPTDRHKKSSKKSQFLLTIRLGKGCPNNNKLFCQYSSYSNKTPMKKPTLLSQWFQWGWEGKWSFIPIRWLMKQGALQLYSHSVVSVEPSRNLIFCPLLPEADSTPIPLSR